MVLEIKSCEEFVFLTNGGEDRANPTEDDDDDDDDYYYYYYLYYYYYYDHHHCYNWSFALSRKLTSFNFTAPN